MTSLFDKGRIWLEAQRVVHASSQIQYYRGTAIIGMAATMGQTSAENMDADGSTIPVKIMDWLIPGDELVINGVPVFPAAGDKIKYVRNGLVLVYEVLDLGGAGLYSVSDPVTNRLRIHTKLVKE